MSDPVYIIIYVTRGNVIRYHGHTTCSDVAEEMLAAAWDRDDCTLAFMFTGKY
jgi:hypothetical protein